MLTRTRRARGLAALNSLAVAAGILFVGVAAGVATSVASAGPASAAADCDADGGIPGGLTRADILARGKRWVDAHISYDQDDCNTDSSGREYRTDCSGFVSMAWGLSQSYSTTSFSDDTSQWKTIAWSDLQPGDALTHPAHGSTKGHIVLFVRWTNTEKTSFVLYEEKGTGFGTIETTYTVSYAKDENFHPIRYQHLKASTASITEGSFISNNGTIYRVAGGAPVYVSSWANVGGQHSTVEVSADFLADLNPVPIDGTFVRDYQTGATFRMAGGAPIYVSTWDAFPGATPTVIDLDGNAIARAGTGGVYNHLRQKPREGTFLAANQTGHVYRVAGGAPVYVSNWAAFGGPQRAVNVDGAALGRAGEAGHFSHLNARPVDGTFIAAAESGAVFRIAGGAPIYVSTWTAFNPGGDPAPTVMVDDAAINRAGEAGAFAHLNRRPVDGTFVEGGQTSQAYRIVGGAPVYVSTWDAFGGSPQSTVKVDQNALDRAGQDGWYSRLDRRPVDGTLVKGAQSGQYYRFAGGAPLYISTWDAFGGSAPGPVTTVDQAVLDRAGEAGVWSHVSAQPDDGTFLHAGQSGRVYRVVGGAPLYVSTWSVFGGQQPYTTVDEVAMDRAGQSGAWSHLSYRPVDGTLLTAAPSGAKYTVSGGRPVAYTGSAAIPATNTVDGYAVTHAGEGGYLNHLLP